MKVWNTLLVNFKYNDNASIEVINQNLAKASQPIWIKAQSILVEQGDSKLLWMPIENLPREYFEAFLETHDWRLDG